MLGVTLFGIFLTPVFYYVIQWLKDRRRRAKPSRELPKPSGNGVAHPVEGKAVSLLEGVTVRPAGEG